MKNQFLRTFLKFFGLILLALCCVGCSANVISPADYSGLLLGAKTFFEVSMMLLNSAEANYNGQGIARMYYGCYYVARLIYNNYHYRDSTQHYITWEKMPVAIREYGEHLKELRVKYDYNPFHADEKELTTDLQYIYNNRDKFHEMIEELRLSNTDLDYIKAFDRNVLEVEKAYGNLIDLIKNKLKEPVPN